ncbi:MAG: hypothetical protein AAF633_06350 [Chloroflexota bacterium]
MERTAEDLTDEIWEAVLDKADDADLDSSLLGENHKEIVRLIAAYLTSEDERLDEQHRRRRANEALAEQQREIRDKIKSRRRRKQEPTPEEEAILAQEPVTVIDPINPILLCGPPGTGKTTFLYILDSVLRNEFDLDDNLKPRMRKSREQYHLIQKRNFDGDQVSLLSVRKWSELLRFYAWDVRQHRFEFNDLEQFIEDQLLDMKVIFADEVEISGYSPTLTDLAKYGLLVIASSNQIDFPQFDVENLSPSIYMFDGVDMRIGEPEDAIINESDSEWKFFDEVKTESILKRESVLYRHKKIDRAHFFYFDFPPTIRAPMLETDWLRFFNEAFIDASGRRKGIQSNTALILLFDNYSLDAIREDYNSIIRYISLFDAIEQIEIGVLVRNPEGSTQLSRAAMEEIKHSIETTPGIVEEVKRRTLVGIDRSTSRIGKAGLRAKGLLD